MNLVVDGDTVNQRPGLTSSELIGAARRRALIVVLFAVLVPLSALGWSLAQDEQFTASAQLLFRDPGFDQKLFGSSVLQPSINPERQAATNVLLLSNRRIAERTARADRFGLSATEIASRVQVRVEGQADVISVSMTDTRPVRAAELANVYARQYIQFRREADRAKIREAQSLAERQLQRLSPTARNTEDAQALRRQADQLGVLASLQTGNAELVEPAQIPSSPSAPRTMRNVAVGAIVGILAGFGLSFVLERFDRRLRDPDDVEAAFGHPILGIVPESRTLKRVGKPLTGMLGGAEDESFNMVRANLRYFNIGRQVRSILVTSAMPGEGKTLVAWNLAVAAVSSGDRVLFVDADLRSPLTLQDPQGEADPHVGLGAFLAGHAELDEVIRQLPVPDAEASASPRHLDVIPAAIRPPNPIDLLESDAMQRLISDSHERYDLVIIDSPPTPVVSDAIPLITAVHGVLVVVRLGHSTRQSVQQLRRQLENLGAPTLGVVVNGAAAPSYRYGYGYPGTAASPTIPTATTVRIP